MTIKEETDETLNLYDCLRIEDRRTYEDLQKSEIIDLFRDLKAEAKTYATMGTS